MCISRARTWTWTRDCSIEGLSVHTRDCPRGRTPIRTPRLRCGRNPTAGRDSASHPSARHGPRLRGRAGPRCARTAKQSRSLHRPKDSAGFRPGRWTTGEWGPSPSIRGKYCNISPAPPAWKSRNGTTPLNDPKRSRTSRFGGGCQTPSARHLPPKAPRPRTRRAESVFSFLIHHEYFPTLRISSTDRNPLQLLCIVPENPYADQTNPRPIVAR